jgi:hypothetical protein
MTSFKRMTNFKGQLTTIETICQFMFAGNATLTLRSKKTDARYTYQVRESDDGHCHFVSLLNGENNEGDFVYLGHFRGGVYSHGRKSSIGAEAPSAKAFTWFASKILRSQLPAELEVWHEGRCGHCNRKLTVPESVATGFGPDCSEKLGIVRVQCEVIADPILPPPVAEPVKSTVAEQWNDRLQVRLDETAVKATEGLSPDPKTGMFLPSTAWLAQQARVKAKIAAMRRR